MNHRWNIRLQRAAAPPPPERKTAFLRQHRRRELSLWGFLRVQAGYMQWWVWPASVGVLALAALLVWGQEGAQVCLVSALTPLLATLAAAEGGKSSFYGMEELERSCRSALRSVVLARITVLGAFHLALLGVLTPVLAVCGAMELLRAGVYLLAPYLLTAVVCTELSRRVRGREGLYACAGGGVTVACLCMAAGQERPELYAPEAAKGWYLALAVLTVLAAAELYGIIRRTEA